VPRKLIVFLPLPAKVVSRSPGLAMRRPYRECRPALDRAAVRDEFSA
jgi:hypothetical protein